MYANIATHVIINAVYNASIESPFGFNITYVNKDACSIITSYLSELNYILLTQKLNDYYGNTTKTYSMGIDGRL